MAVKYADVNTVQALISAGANLQFKDASGYSPVSYSIRTKGEPIMALLIQNPKILAEDANSIFAWAIAHASRKLVELCVKAGFKHPDYSEYYFSQSFWSREFFSVLALGLGGEPMRLNGGALQWRLNELLEITRLTDKENCKAIPQLACRFIDEDCEEGIKIMDG
jgi:hypothetical protein